MSLFSVKTSIGTFDVDLANDFYGKEYWEAFGSGQYEPDTIHLISNFCDRNTLFLDIGAANGGMTLLAGLTGAEVIAVEPNPQMFEVLSRNIDLNFHGDSRISAVKGLVAVKEISGVSGRNIGKRLTSIVLTHWDTSEDEFLDIYSIRSLVGENKEYRSRLVVKMDIEGAEWNLLSDDSTLSLLAQKEALLILAIHPGLQHPLTSPRNILARMVWNIRNLYTSTRFFFSVSRYAAIMRTNLNKVNACSKFLLLSLGGCHEFVLDFQKNKS